MEAREGDTARERDSVATPPRGPVKSKKRTPSSSFSGTDFLSALAASIYRQHIPVLVLSLIPVLSVFLWAR